MLSRLLQIIDEVNPTRLFILGDVKHTVSKISLSEWREVPQFFETVQERVRDIWVIRGNHDGDLEPLTPPSTKLFPSSGTVLEGEPKVGFFHGNAWPSPEVISSDILVMAHLHPVMRLRGRFGFSAMPIWLKMRCEGKRLAQAYLNRMKLKVSGDPLEEFTRRFEVSIGDPRLIVMPTFNDLIGGLSVTRMERALMGTLLGSEGVDLEGAEVYLLDGTYLGTIKQLRELLESKRIE